MKHEWKKEENELYLPKAEPQLLTVPKLKFITIDGVGNPNGPEFAAKVTTLYNLAYGIKMIPKTGYLPQGYFEYTVYPLEGVWDLSEEGRIQTTLNKDELVYKIMIRQPEFVTEEVFKKALENVKSKKQNPLLDTVNFEKIEDGPSIQILHNGSYDDEPVSFTKMKDYLTASNLERRELRHREIYLSDARKVEKDKLKTVLRYFLKT